MNLFETAPAIRLRSAYLRMHRLVNRLLEPLGATADQYVVLRFLAEKDGISQRRLVEQCASDPTTIGRMLELLDSKGLIKRSPDPLDSRARQVHLTVKGRNLCARLTEATAAVRAAFEVLEPDEYASLLSSLEKVSEAFSRELNQPKVSRSGTPTSTLPL